MRISLVALLLFILTGPGALYSQTNFGKLEIAFEGLRNKEGQVAIGINEIEKGWPRKPQLEYQWKKSSAVNGELTVVVDQLKYGTYAISLLDDENMNQKMDNILGIPIEGFGFSNNPKVKLSAPDFEACSFQLDQAYKKIIIQVNYF